MTRADVGSEEDGPRLLRDRPGLLTVAVGPLGRFGDTAVRTLERLARLGRESTGDVRVVVLDVSGVGTEQSEATTDSAFAALASLPADERDAVLAGYQEAVAWLRRADLVSVATARGPLTGIAVEFVLCCDLRLLAADASLVLPGAPAGSLPESAPVLGVTGRLVDLVGAGRATELCLTGRPVGAVEAERLGLATRVVPGDDLDAATDGLVSRLLTADRDGLAETKALLAGAAHRTPREQAAAEREAFARALEWSRSGES